MVKRTFQALTNKIGGLQQAAFWLSLFALFSQILALLRDRLLAHNFGAGAELDIYYAAFKIPDLLFVTVASLVSISALVPLFAKKETEGEKHLRDATASIFTVFSIFIILSCIIAWFLMPYIVSIAFSSLPHLARTQTIHLSRILLLSPLLLGFSNFFGSIVQYEKRFILYSLSPLLYNIGIILGIVFLTSSFGIEGVVWGVVLGALLHFALQSIFIFTSASRLRPSFTSKIKWGDVWETARLSVPRTLALSIISFVGFFFVALASGLGEGAIAVFNLSFNLQSAPLSLIGVSFSLAAFPALAISVAKKDMQEVIVSIGNGLRQIIFWSLPLTALMIILRAHLVRVVLGSGGFDWSATRLTAAVLAILVISTVFQSIALFLSRSHYALGKTKWPLLGNLAGGAVSVVCAIVFIKYFQFFAPVFQFMADLLNVSHLPQNILLLPFAYSIGSFVSALLLFFLLGSHLTHNIWKHVKSTIFHSILGALAAGLGAYATLSVFDGFFNLDTFFGVLGHGFVGSMGGVALGILMLYILGNKEITPLLNLFFALTTKGKPNNKNTYE